MDMKEEKTIADKKAAVLELVELGKKKGVLSFKEIEEAVSDLDFEVKDMEKLYENLENMGIELVKDMEKELEEIQTSEEEIDISVPEGIGLDDPVRMYLKDIGKVPLLSADEEMMYAERMHLGDEEAKKNR